MEVGYIIASHRVTKDGMKVGYIYREQPDNEKDSGWRVFSGDESQEYVDDPRNFAMYNASTIIKMDPEIVSLLALDYPVAFERKTISGGFVMVALED